MEMQMMDNNVEKYDNSLGTLLAQDQIALLLSIDSCIESGVCFSLILQRIISYEENSLKRAVWRSAGADLSTGTPIYEILVKTGFFSSQVETILLAVQDPDRALKSAIKYLSITHS